MNFDGTFKGAGKGVTVVQTHGDEPFPLLEPPFMPYPSLFVFYQEENGAPSNLRFSDMTIRAIGETVEWNIDGFPPVRRFQYLLEVGAWITGVEDFEPSYVSTTVERMAFEGEVGDFPTDYNVGHALDIAGTVLSELAPGGIRFKYGKPFVGAQIVTDCSFRNAGVGSSVYEVWDSTVTIQGCSYDNVGYGVQLADFSNTFAAAERNDFQNVHWFGVWLRAAFPAVVGYHEGPIPELFPEPSSFLISHNTIHAIDVADGIGILDYASLVGAGKTLEAVVESNTIILDNTWWGGIWGGAAQDVVVAKNQFTGFSYMPGIYMGVFGDSVSGWTILGNNVQNLNAYVAQIWLGSGTSGCTVVGGSTQTNVWDQGTDNILVGVNNMQGNDPGQEIKDAMMQKLAIHR